jgi:hypothetical protein
MQVYYFVPFIVSNRYLLSEFKMVITSGGDFLGLCDQKSSYKHTSDFGRLRSYDRFFIPYTESCDPRVLPADHA